MKRISANYSFDAIHNIAVYHLNVSFQKELVRLAIDNVPNNYKGSLELWLKNKDDGPKYVYRCFLTRGKLYGQYIEHM